jgi:hypothetical protein
MERCWAEMRGDLRELESIGDWSPMPDLAYGINAKNMSQKFYEDPDRMRYGLSRNASKRLPEKVRCPEFGRLPQKRRALERPR